MRTARQMVLGLAMAGLAGLLGACSGGSGGPTGLSNVASGARGADDRPGATTPNGASTGSGVVRIRCEVRPGRSKISVDGNNLSPRNATFTARVTSGANGAASAAQTAIGDEAEFDFDSATGEFGAVRIAADFIVVGAVTGEIVDAAGRVVARGSAQCEVR